MKGDPVCPRCHGFLRAPSAWQASWTCSGHGPVPPLRPFRQPSADFVRALAARSHLPLWLPWPLPRGWVITGVGYAGTDTEGVRATVVACSGPNPLGGAGELLLVAEELGVGLGASYGGLVGPDPGEAFGHGPPQAKVDVAGRPTSLWFVPSPHDRAVYAGEAEGRWLWLVLFPGTAGALLVEPIDLADMGTLGHEVDLLPYGALTPRLRKP
ncbi:MAG TPA: DUF6758 family protein [Actinopolymorphaceae bacterium]|nr:DUF6758 family protein [Actinopolymorphaceae bacterium]